MAKKMKKKGFAGGGKLPMVEKDGKKVPAFAADGKGKMAKGGMAKKGYAGGGKVKKKGFMAGGPMPPMGGGMGKVAGGMGSMGASGAGGGMKAKMAELQKRADAGDPQAKAELAKLKRSVGPRAELSPPTPAKPMMPMKKGGMAKKGYAKGGMAKKNGKKATKSKGKVRGAGIAKKGVRKCKMR